MTDVLDNAKQVVSEKIGEGVKAAVANICLSAANKVAASATAGVRDLYYQLGKRDARLGKATNLSQFTEEQIEGYVRGNNDEEAVIRQERKRQEEEELWHKIISRSLVGLSVGAGAVITLKVIGWASSHRKRLP